MSINERNAENAVETIGFEEAWQFAAEMTDAVRTDYKMITTFSGRHPEKGYATVFILPEDDAIICYPIVTRV